MQEREASNYSLLSRSLASTGVFVDDDGPRTDATAFGVMTYYLGTLQREVSTSSTWDGGSMKPFRCFFSIDAFENRSIQS
jgi:hypothetical protein